jgi:hypothetical protein
MDFVYGDSVDVAFGICQQFVHFLGVFFCGVGDFQAVD